MKLSPSRMYITTSHSLCPYRFLILPLMWAVDHTTDSIGKELGALDHHSPYTNTSISQAIAGHRAPSILYCHNEDTLTKMHEDTKGCAGSVTVLQTPAAVFTSRGGNPSLVQSPPPKGIPLQSPS